MGKTIIEKIISSHSTQSVKANDLVIVNVDAIMATDTTAPLALKAFEAMEGDNVWDPDKMFLIIDHASPAPNERIANLHVMMRKFSAKHGIKLYDIGEGICHQIMIENGHARPGQIVLGADSHTCTYGAIGTFSTGVGSTDLAGVMISGQTWLKVPETIKIQLNGTLPKGVSAKDLILYLVGKLTIDGATYQAIEFAGEAIESMSLDSRMTIANMAIEMGAKAGFVHTKGLQLPYEFEHVIPDLDANYVKIHEFNVSELEPQVAIPHSPDQVKGVSEIEGIPVQHAFIGSCTNGRLEDLHIAASILKGKRVHKDVRLLIAPASKKVFLDALKDGTVETLIEAGASFITSGCGPCVGTHQGIPGNGETVVSSTNRNFQGRMGNRNSYIYLGSPAFVATSALFGETTNPLTIQKSCGNMSRP